MVDDPRYFEKAADALRQAMTATSLGEEALLLEEALRLNRLALAVERAKLSRIGGSAPPTSQPYRSRRHS